MVKIRNATVSTDAFAFTAKRIQTEVFVRSAGWWRPGWNKSSFWAFALCSMVSTSSE
jgi:hypothetical protein